MERHIDSILDTGGRQLTPEDRQFVTTLYKELETFQFQAPKDRALMFHPLGGYQRYLIHKVTEVFPKLTSFSIGDDTDRRTVVCFKNKSSKKGKTDPAHLPRPLRQKKNAQSQSLPRSRSLHASPNREHDQPYYTDDDGRKRKKNNDKPLSRSTSMKDTRKNRSASRPTSPPDSHRKSKTLPKSATELSLQRRGHGLQLEGKVVNGDVEDPYNQDSDADRHRNDIEAIKKHKRPSSRSSTRKEKLQHSRSEPIKKHEKITKADVIPHKNGDFSDSSMDSEDHEYVVMKPKHSPSTSRRSNEKTSSKTRENSTKRKSKKEKERNDSPSMSNHRKNKFPNGYVDEYLPKEPENNDYLSLDDDVPFNEYDRKNDQIPPPYVSPESAAERNLNRIKRSDSNRSASSSTRSKTSVPSSIVKEVEKKPKSEKKKKSKDSVDGKSTSRKHVETETEIEEVKPKKERRKSTSSTKGKSPSKKKRKEDKKKDEAVLAQPAVETEKLQKNADNELKPNPEDILVASNGTLYMPLPSTAVQPSASALAENFYVNQPEPTTTTLRCDSEAQTEMRGTLPRDKNKPSKLVAMKEDASHASSSPYETANSSQQASDMTSPPNSTSSDPTKFVEDFCKMMLNFQNMALNNQKEKEKSNPPTPPKQQFSDPKLVNPFAAFYPGSQSGQQPTPPHSLYSQFPPHVSYQLYMSWMAAYYAGATGSWPPPPPFASYSQTDKPNMPYDYHNITNVFQAHPNYQNSGDGYSSSAHPSPQKPFESFDNSDMYPSSFQPSSRKGTEVYGSDRSQSPFEHLASVSMSSNLDDNKSSTEKLGSVRGKDKRGVKSRSNSTIASAKVNIVDAVLTHNDGADTDASSITSSSTKPEVAVQSGPKDEVKENGFPEASPTKEDPLTNGKQSDSPTTNYDYYNYTPNEEMYKSEPYNRIAEIYDFEPNFKDANIVPHFFEYNGFKLWWVDDTHALGVFSSTDHHDDAITKDIPYMKIRPMLQASTKSKKKARLRIEDFGEKGPMQPRPKTDSSVARRMITNALGGSAKKSNTGSLKQPKKKKSQDRRKSSTT